MKPVSQTYLDALKNAHGNIEETLRAFMAVEQDRYIPIYDLLESVRNLPTDVSKLSPNAYIFGSGVINSINEINYKTYTDELINNGSRYITIGGTPAGNFIGSNLFDLNFNKSFDNSNLLLKPKELLHGYINQDGTRTTGLWDDISRGYAENARGAIITVTPHALENRIFVQTELPALLKNPNIETINGLEKQIFVDAFEKISASGLPSEKVYSKLNDTLVRGSSIEYMKRFAAPSFGRDLGTVLQHDYTKAANPEVAELLKMAQPETSMFRNIFNIAAPSLKVGGKIVSALPFIGIAVGLGINGAEAADLQSKLQDAIAVKPELAQGLIEYDTILAGHIAQGGDPSVILGEAGVQAAFNNWADRYDVQGSLREELQPSSLALMVKDGSLYMADATVDVVGFTIEKTVNGASYSTNFLSDGIDNMRDNLTGDLAQRQIIFDGLPLIDSSIGDNNPIRDNHAAYNLALIKTQTIWTECKIKAIKAGTDEPVSPYNKNESIEFLQERIAHLNDSFEESYDAAKQDGAIYGILNLVDYNSELNAQISTTASNDEIYTAHNQVVAMEMH